MLAPVVAVQREDYSDIEHRTTNYENIMKDLDKVNLIKNIQNVKHNQQIKELAPQPISLPSVNSIPMKF